MVRYGNLVCDIDIAVALGRHYVDFTLFIDIYDIYRLSIRKVEKGQ